jgi:CheY-like chemotaxis protein
VLENRQPHLIAIDDDKDSAELIARVAARCGYATDVLTDSRALDLVMMNGAPDVICLDLSMPDVNGLDAVEALARVKFGGQVIIVSGHPTCLRQHVSSMAKTHGINVAGHFQKPINTAEFARFLRDVQLDQLHRTA